MKKQYIFGAIALAMSLSFNSCDEFLEIQPAGVIDEETAFQNPDGMVTAAYSELGNDWYQYAFNLWHYGDLASDDCLKGGSGLTDTELHPVEVWSSLTSSSPANLDELWYRLYVAISRCNRALISLEEHGETVLGSDLARQREGEVRFLRAHFYWKRFTLFNQIPWIDETVTKEVTHEQVRNDEFTHDELFQKIIDDFKFAYDVLPAKQDKVGRANKIAAASYLAKCYLTRAYGDGYEATTGYAHINKADISEVLKYTQEVANSQYGFEADFGDLFLQENANGIESIFAVQHSDYEADNTQYGRANWSTMLNGSWGMWSCGWDFHKPSQNLVNAYKVDANGLPMFDTFDDEIDYPINGMPDAQKWDPRLFHTVAMPTFPYKYETGYKDKNGETVSLIFTTDNSRTPSVYGYYGTLKEIPQRSKGETYDSPWQAFAQNEYVFRFTDVMLMRAEALIENDQLEEARTIINTIRERAKNSVSKHISYAADQCNIGLYPSFASKDYARQALRWERRLEMAMESSRYFDLRRWGLASQTLNAYFQTDKDSYYIVDGKKAYYASYLNDAYYTPGKNEYWPVPYNQLYYVPGLYVQNKGYN